MMDNSLFAHTLGYGVLGLVLYAFAEKFVPVIPSSAFLVFVGMTAAEQPAGVGLSLLAVTLGSTLGAVVLFFVGRHVDEHRIRYLAARFGRYILLPVGQYDRLVAGYRRRSFLVTLFGQLVPVARNYGALSAGTVGIAFLPFLAATIPGALFWNASFLILGVFLDPSS